MNFDPRGYSIDGSSPTYKPEGLGEPEIEHLHLTIAGERDVRGLEVPVDDGLLVRRFQGLGDLPPAHVNTAFQRRARLRRANLRLRF